jgi:hypothetical protein
MSVELHERARRQEERRGGIRSDSLDPVTGEPDVLGCPQEVGTIGDVEHDESGIAVTVVRGGRCLYGGDDLEPPSVVVLNEEPQRHTRIIGQRRLEVAAVEIEQVAVEVLRPIHRGEALHDAGSFARCRHGADPNNASRARASRRQEAVLNQSLASSAFCRCE